MTASTTVDANPAFGLYLSASFGAPGRLAAGRSFALDQPLVRDGVTMFRRSLWLPSPAAAVCGLAGGSGRSAPTALKLSGSALAVRFTPLRLAVGTGAREWFSSVRDSGANETRIEFTWPVDVVRIGKAGIGPAHAVSLHRADGDAVSEEPTHSGVSGRDLDAPWVGSPLVVRLGEPVFDIALQGPALAAQDTTVRIGVDSRARPAPAVPTAPALPAAPSTRAARAAPASRAPAGPVGGGSTGPQAGPAPSAIAGRLPSAVVPSLTLAGRPTTPRLRLVAEQPGGETLLWQALLPGEQADAALPQTPLDAEWASAFEQVRKLDADPEASRRVTRLRLDIESDSPCTAQITALQLTVEAEFELLAAPLQFRFDGVQAPAAAIPLDMPAGPGLSGATLTLGGHVGAEAAANLVADMSGTDGRRGIYLDGTQRLCVPVPLAAPAALAGATLHWHPTSPGLRARARLWPEGGGGPGARPLAQAEVTVNDVAPGWIAVRWPVVVLQPQRLRLEWLVAEGSGLLAFASGGIGSAWLEPAAAGSAASSAQRLPLPEPLALSLLEAAPDAASDAVGAPRPFGLSIGPVVVAAELPQGAFERTVAGPLLPLLATQPLLLTGGARGSVAVASARLVLRSG